MECNLVGPIDEGTGGGGGLALPFRDLQPRTTNFCLNVLDTLYLSNLRKRLRAEV